MAEQPVQRAPTTEPSIKPPPGAVAADAAASAGKLRLRVGVLSDVGQARDHQEDAVGAFAPPDPGLLAQKGQLFIVADGMGGHNAGEVASQAALSEIQRSYYAAPTNDIPAALQQALSAANQAIYRAAHGEAPGAAARTGMGTTAAVAVVRDQEVHVANVGDSRVYLVRNGNIAQITEDHSWVEEQVRAGVLTREQARSHPQRNVITRALGTGARVEPDLFHGALHEGEVLLLCSDGLTGHVSDAELMDRVSRFPPEQAVRRLVDLANQRGGTDNISVIVVRGESPMAPIPALPAAAASGRQRLPILALAVAAFLLIAAGAVAAVLLGRGGPASATPTVAAQESPVAAVAITPTLTSTLVLVTGTMTTTLATPTAAVVAVAETAAGEPTATLAVTPTLTATPLPTTPAPTQAATPTRAAPPSPQGAATPTSIAVPLPAPVLIEPQDESTVQERVTFTWGPVPGATGYRVETRSDRIGQQDWRAWPVGNQTRLVIAYDSYSDYFNTPGTVYYWRVLALNANNQPGTPSLERTFIFSRPGSPADTPTPQPATETPVPTDTPPPTATRAP